MRVILSAAYFDIAIGLDRESISTFLQSEEWWAEADWDGRQLGDVLLYRSTIAQMADYRSRMKADPSQEGQYTKGEYFGCVPPIHVKCYRFKDGEPSDVQPKQVSVSGTSRARQAAA